MWSSFRNSLKKFKEIDVHPHICCERAEGFTTASFESTEVDYLDLLYGLVRCIKPRSVVETGCHFGISSTCIALALCENEKDGAENGRLLSIEIERTNLEHAIATAEAWGVLQHIDFIQGDSVDYLTTGAIPAFDMGFFDSTRTRRALEFRAIYNRTKFNRNAIAAFHDTSRHRSMSMASQRVSQDLYLSELDKILPLAQGCIELTKSRGLRVFQLP
ncbi:class I SAM-dependent methyltransferase [Rhodopseudomonas sp. AAP120]|uniref:O-methyltransferase n=1 Tax=Rhodopseudomonas sp. AAP120 TaxID=1523430 RepID=UPI0009E9A215|nr:class I SAM-dependent methyltransferase [Rhodopseudomonas sp. AAP120]